MKPKLMIHAGIHRTGTTALQKLLAHYRGRLAEKGIVYPFSAANHQSIAWSLFRKQMSGTELADQLAGQLPAGVTCVVLSGEDFAIHKDLTWLGALQAHFDCEAIFYLRRQDEWVMSWYNQHVKWPFDARKSRMSPEEFLLTIDDYHWLDYERLLDRWAEGLGRGKLHVAVMERGALTDTSTDFLRRIGMEPLPAPEVAVNESIPAAALEIMRHLSVYELPEGQRIILQRAVVQGLLPTLKSGRNVYAPDIRNRIIDRFAASNARVARRYLGRDDGQLFLESRCPAGESHDRATLPASEELLSRHIAPLVRQLAALAAGAAAKARRQQPS